MQTYQVMNILIIFFAIKIQKSTLYQYIMNIAIARLLAEQKNMRKDRKYMFFAKPTKNIKIWEAGFPGPNIPLYQNSYYLVKIEFNDKYPYQSPRVVFKYPVYHPNVYTNGDVCLSIFQNGWKASFTINNILYGLQQLLANPNKSSPANSSAAKNLSKTIKYEELVRKNIEKYHSKMPWQTE